MANTGYKGWNTLEEYDINTGQATGNTKPNTEGDPDYIEPVFDPSSCPIKVQLATDLNTGSNTCGQPTDEEYFIDANGLFQATVIYENSSLTTLAPAAYYGDGLGYRYWNGNGFTGGYTSCS